MPVARDSITVPFFDHASALASNRCAQSGEYYARAHAAVNWGSRYFPRTKTYAKNSALVDIDC
jgi:hypothetical protein